MDNGEDSVVDCDNITDNEKDVIYLCSRLLFFPVI
jgi:hypothetical protein